MHSTIVLKIPQRTSHFIVPAVVLSLASDFLLCFPYSQIVFNLSESPPTPRAQKCTSQRFVPALNRENVYIFKT